VYGCLTRTLYETVWNDENNLEYRNGFVDISHNSLDGDYKRELKSLIPFLGIEDKDNLSLWNINGAKDDVSGASTPVGLSNNVFKFTADSSYEKN